MNRYVLGIVGALALIVVPQPAQSQDLVAEGLAAREYDTTLPPVGFVEFCKNYPVDCKKYSASEREKPKRHHMNVERWSMLFQVNAYVNRKVKPKSDKKLYGKEEHWAYPVDAGDCEDYLLLKKQFLEELGFPRKVLRITVVLDERNEGHAVLTVVTDGGDLVLDNRRDEIWRWRQTGYTFLKRQGAHDPTHWVALVKVPPTVATTGP